MNPPRKLFPGKVKLSRRDFDRVVAKLIRTVSFREPVRKYHRPEAVAKAVGMIRMASKRRAA